MMRRKSFSISPAPTIIKPARQIIRRLQQSDRQQKRLVRGGKVFETPGNADVSARSLIEKRVNQTNFFLRRAEFFKHFDLLPVDADQARVKPEDKTAQRKFSRRASVFRQRITARMQRQNAFSARRQSADREQSEHARRNFAADMNMQQIVF
jgi:hypothetical protein